MIEGTVQRDRKRESGFLSCDSGTTRKEGSVPSDRRPKPTDAASIRTWEFSCLLQI